MSRAHDRYVSSLACDVLLRFAWNLPESLCVHTVVACNCNCVESCAAAPPLTISCRVRALVPAVSSNVQIAKALLGVRCGGLSAPPNGRVSGHNAWNTSCDYACDYGYVLVGSATRICLQTGKWSGTEPRCQVDCKLLPDADTCEVRSCSSCNRGLQVACWHAHATHAWEAFTHTMYPPPARNIYAGL